MRTHVKVAVFAASIGWLGVVILLRGGESPLLLLPAFAGLGSLALARGVARLREPEPDANARPLERAINIVLDGPLLGTSPRFGAIMQVVLGFAFLGVSAYGLAAALV